MELEKLRDISAKYSEQKKIIQASIARIASEIKRLFSELILLKSVDIRGMSQSMFLTFFPDEGPYLEVLAELNVDWDYLCRAASLNDIDVDEVRTAAKAERELEEQILGHHAKIRNLRSKAECTPKHKLGPSAKTHMVRECLQKIVFRLQALATELGDPGGTPAKYISKDVYSVMYPGDRYILNYMSENGIPWSHLLRLACIDSTKFESKDLKKTAGIVFRTISDHFGISAKHYIFMQKVMYDMMHEDPDKFLKVVNTVFPHQFTDVSSVKDILTNISSMVNYLQQIE